MEIATQHYYRTAWDQLRMVIITANGQRKIDISKEKMYAGYSGNKCTK